MKNKYLLDILPSYNYKFKIIGFFLLFFSIAFLIVSQLLHLNYVRAEIFQLLIAFSLMLILSSKDKIEQNNSVFIRYYSGKIAATFMLGFIMSFKLADLIVKETYSVDILTLIIAVMAIYLMSYYILKYLTKNKEIEIKEKSVTETFLNHKKFYYLIFVASIITLAVIYLIGY